MAAVGALVYKNLAELKYGSTREKDKSENPLHTKIDSHVTPHKGADRGNLVVSLCVRSWVCTFQYTTTKTTVDIIQR